MGYVFDPESQMYIHRNDPRARHLMDAVMANQQRHLNQAEYDALLKRQRKSQQKTQAMQAGRYPARWKKQPGQIGFNQYVTDLMEKAGVLSEGTDVRCTDPGEPPYDQPYQRTVAYLFSPHVPFNPRLLVAHRTGSGKTLTMIRCLSNYFDDPRPKMAIFPEQGVRDQFYAELMAWDNPYREYVMGRLGWADCPDLEARTRAKRLASFELGSVIDVLGLKGHPRSAGQPGFMAAPLRAFSYNELGGQSIVSSHRWLLPRVPRTINGRLNILDDKVIVMDEAHNLIKPNLERFKLDRSLANLEHARDSITAARNSCVALFTATPIVDSTEDADRMMQMVRGDENGCAVNDEGFISAFLGSPASAYPRAIPNDNLMPTIVRVELEGDADDPTTSLGGYLEKIHKKKEFMRSKTRNIYEYTQAYTSMQTRPAFIKALRDRPTEVAPQLYTAARLIQETDGKAIVLTAQANGFFSLMQMIDTHEAFRDLRGRVHPLLGSKHTTRPDYRPQICDGASQGQAYTNCMQRQFNESTNSMGDETKALVLNADQFSEGIDFKDVRRVILLDIPKSWANLRQRVGRAIRHCSSKRLPADMRTVEIFQLVGALPPYAKVNKGRDVLDLRNVLTVDEQQLIQIMHDREIVERRMCQLIETAFDRQTLYFSTGGDHCQPPQFDRHQWVDARNREHGQCMKEMARCARKVIQKAPDVHNQARGIAMCRTALDECLHRIPQQATVMQAGRNCPPGYDRPGCIRWCRSRGMSGRDLGKCMSRANYKQTTTADSTGYGPHFPDCPQCPEGMAPTECKTFCTEKGLTGHDLYTCMSRTSKQCRSPPQKAPKKPEPVDPAANPPKDKVYNPLKKSYIKRGAALHRALCADGTITDCDGIEETPKKTEKKKRKTPAKKAVDDTHRKLCKDGVVADCLFAR